MSGKYKNFYINRTNNDRYVCILSNNGEYLNCQYETILSGPCYFKSHHTAKFNIDEYYRLRNEFLTLEDFTI